MMHDPSPASAASPGNRAPDHFLIRGWANFAPIKKLYYDLSVHYYRDYEQHGRARHQLRSP